MKEWLSIRDYANQHQISDMTVRRRIKSGLISAILKDGKYFITRQESIAQSRFEDHSLTENKQGHQSGAVTHNSSEKQSSTSSYQYSQDEGYPNAFSDRTYQDRNVSIHVKTLERMIAVCETFLWESKKQSKTAADLHETQMTNLNLQLELKDQLISEMQEKIEDLETLLKILDQKRGDFG